MISPNSISLDRLEIISFITDSQIWDFNSDYGGF